MDKVLHRADTRGFADHGWLKAHHTFSFAEYRNAARVHFGLLRVLNDDWIAPGQGFGTHPHENMEIVTIPLTGALRHEDSMGFKEVIRSGEVQRMSAGTGVTHSEFNDSKTEPVSLLQIWVFPKKMEITPSYAQKKFDSKGRANTIQTVVAPDGREGALSINQDAFFSLTDLAASHSIDYEIHFPDNGAYVFLIEGSAQIDGEILNRRDGIGISSADWFSVDALTNTQALIIEIPQKRNSVP